MSYDLTPYEDEPFEIHLRGGRFDGMVLKTPGVPDEMVLPFFFPAEYPSPWYPAGMLEVGFHIYRQSPLCSGVMVFDYAGTRDDTDKEL